MTREVLKKGLETFREREKSYRRSTAGGAIYDLRMELVSQYDLLAELYGVCKEMNSLHLNYTIHRLAVHVQTIHIQYQCSYIHIYVCD